VPSQICTVTVSGSRRGFAPHELTPHRQVKIKIQYNAQDPTRVLQNLHLTQLIPDSWMQRVTCTCNSWPRSWFRQVGHREQWRNLLAGLQGSWDDALRSFFIQPAMRHRLHQSECNFSIPPGMTCGIQYVYMVQSNPIMPHWTSLPTPHTRAGLFACGASDHQAWRRMPADGLKPHTYLPDGPQTLQKKAGDTTSGKKKTVWVG
jgi:hypothetical protein